MRQIDRDKTTAIQQRMAGLTGKAASAAANTCARDFGISVKYVYEITREFRPRRKRRSDTATTHIDLTDKQRLYLLSQIIENKTSAECALQTAQDTENKDLCFYIPPEVEITPQTINRWLSSRGLGYADRKQVSAHTPYTKRSATSANEVWFLDGTVGEQFYIEEDGEHIFWHDPINRRKPRLPQAIILNVVDGFSRVEFMDLYTAEDAVSLCDFTYKACTPKYDFLEFPFYGIPTEIYSDPGPAMMAAKFRRFCDVMDVTFIPHKPRHPWSKGMVERAFRTLIDRQRARKRAPRWTKAEFRNFLYRYCLMYNNRVHSSTGEKPFVRWTRSIESGEAVFRAAPPETLKRLLSFDLVERTLEPSGEIRAYNRRFYIGRELQTRMAALVGHKVEVLLDHADKDRIYVTYRGEAHACQATGIIPRKVFDGAGKPPAHSERERILKAVKSAEATEMLKSVKGVGLPAAGSGPKHELTREPISWEAQIRKKGRAEKIAITRWDAREMLLDAGLLGDYVDPGAADLAESLLNKMVSMKMDTGEAIYDSEVMELIREIEKLAADADKDEKRNVDAG